MNEIDRKLLLMRQMLTKYNLSGFLLRGTDWFAWATGGRSNVVLLAAETGIAEILVTPRDAYILTDAIEAERLIHEEATPRYLLWSAPWQDASARKAFILDQTRGGLLACDRPRGVEYAFPHELWLRRRELLPEEQARYRQLGREASEAMTEALQACSPEWTEFDLAAAGSSALWKRGIEPALILVGGEERLPRYRHPIATAAPIGTRGMMVFCARRHGLYANLTRFVYFRKPNRQEEKDKLDLAQIEADIFEASRPGTVLAAIYKKMQGSYQQLGHAEQLSLHHQGGPTGYQAREDIVSPHTDDLLRDATPLAWNPSLVGCKIEDTVLLREGSLEILTVDPAWPTFTFGQRQRPDFLVRL